MSYCPNKTVGQWFTAAVIIAGWGIFIVLVGIGIFGGA